MTEIINAIDELVNIAIEIDNTNESIKSVLTMINKRNDLIKLIKDYKIKECNCDK